MQHVIEATNIPTVLRLERRRHPHRRGAWRGGRRDEDWTNRPVDAWRHLERRMPVWRQWIAKMTALGQ